MDVRDGDAHRLEEEIVNEPQWIVFHDATDEDRWAAEELEELSQAVAGWSTVRR
jgi:hypothetical protein